MSKKTIIIVAVVFFILPVSLLLDYYIAISSEPFQYSRDAIQKSFEVREVVGEVKSIKLASLGYAVRYNGPKGWAEFEMELIGSKGLEVLFVRLERNLGTGQIIGANLNRKDFKL